MNNPWIRTGHPWRITVVPAQTPPPGAEHQPLGPVGGKRYRVACTIPDCKWSSGPHATKQRCNDLARTHTNISHRIQGDIA